MRLNMLGLGAATALLASSCNVSQPPIGCPVQSLEWAATYQLVGTTSCPRKWGEPLGVQKFSSPSGEERLSIKPATLAGLDARDPARLPYSLGAMPKQAGEDGFCVIPSLEVAEKRAPANAALGLPELNVSYTWSNVKVLAKPEAPGTQLVADLEYTENGCTARYEVWAVWPGDIECANEDGAPDDSLCAKATTLNQDFATRCDEHILRCVPARRPPSFK